MQTTRSWVAFQKGRFSEALALLRRAAEALSQTDDYVNRGNIYSAHGRIARRQGRYDYAVECFDRAISEYRQTETAHLQLGRTLLNLAFVKRLLALDRQKQSDRVAASRRLRKIEGAETVELLQDRRASIESIRAEARAHLDESLAVYGPRNNHRGIAGVHINSGFLRLDAGDLERAAADAAEAFRHGEEKHDHIIMARARTLQCIIENAAVEEQLDDPSRHLDAAESHASDAVHYAGHTQNRRLLARAYVWQGLTFAAHSPPNLEAARNCCEQALALLHTEGAEKQKVWDDLEALRARVLRGTPIDPVLRAWCSGVTGDKPFQQLEEEFARIVIPKVWEREGRKVSRVAEKLSISPKKVRRILYAAGLLGASSADGAE